MKYYVVDAFTDELFKGNPAGVCVLDHQLDDSVMQNIAAENNLSETAFVRKTDHGYDLRWFTPSFEIDLCGHATLATAFVISNYVDPGIEKMCFSTLSGLLEVTRKDNLYEMKFPLRQPEKVDVTEEMEDIIGMRPLEAYAGRDLFLVLEDEAAVRNVIPDYHKMRKLTNWLGIVVTAAGGKREEDGVAFVSRYFCPELELEDPVTGSSHCSLVPLWAEKLKMKTMKARQLSSRGGTLFCSQEDTDGSVTISGNAVLYMCGEILK